MIATNPIPDVCNYAQCGEKCAPTPEQAAAGLVPLATIPAQRWNSLWNAANQSVNCLKSAAGALIDEINSVLTATGITPDPTRTDQLYQAIDCIRNALGTDQVAGSVKSSSVAGQVSIDTNGFMTANCVGNATQLVTSCKELTGAVNELKTTYDNAFTQVWGNAAWITDCRADVCHSSDELTYGGGTSTLYGHVKLSDVYDSCVGNAASSVAASQLTLYCLTQAVENMSGLSNCPPTVLGTCTVFPAAGTSPQAARADHVHCADLNGCWPITGAASTAPSTILSGSPAYTNMNVNGGISGYDMMFNPFAYCPSRTDWVYYGHTRTIEGKLFAVCANMLYPYDPSSQFYAMIWGHRVTADDFIWNPGRDTYCACGCYCYRCFADIQSQIVMQLGGDNRFVWADCLTWYTNTTGMECKGYWYAGTGNLSPGGCTLQWFNACLDYEFAFFYTGCAMAHCYSNQIHLVNTDIRMYNDCGGSSFRTSAAACNILLKETVCVCTCYERPYCNERNYTHYCLRNIPGIQLIPVRGMDGGF